MPQRHRHVIRTFFIMGLALSLAQDNDKQLQEIAALGLQSCVDSFVVHRDKIIRTQESREMGAKYITELDVESRIACMRACCEALHCDVFIFEEKKPGSCYLFHCGPPQDFKCKFTSHANYSSAVLTDYNVQNAAALKEEMRRNQQEHELKSLRKSELSSSNEYNYFSNSQTLTSDLKFTTTTTTTEIPIKKIQKCNRNQFACANGDDCIAIYNVCDGIPQCNDGSDEAIELGCPVERTTVLPPTRVFATSKPYISMLPDVLRYQQMIQQQKPQYPMIHYNNGQEFSPLSQQQQFKSVEETEIAGINTRQQQQQQLPQNQISSVNYNNLPAGYQWNTYQNPIYNEQPNVNNKFAGSSALDAMQAPIPPYEQEQLPKIFNHKSTDIRLPKLESVNGVYSQDSNPVYAPYYPHVIHHSSWQKNENDKNKISVQHEAIQSIIVSTPAFERNTEKHRVVVTSTTLPPCDSSDNIKHGDRKITDNLRESTKNVHLAVTSPTEPVVKSDIHKVHELEIRMSDSHLQQHKSMTSVAEYARLHGPSAEEVMRPKSAVISLIFGLTITGIMAVLIVCRMRVVKRRGRGRGHDSFTKDTDYLVNGMYL